MPTADMAASSAQVMPRTLTSRCPKLGDLSTLVTVALQALVTVVVSLGSHGQEFEGGLFVSTGSDRKYNSSI